MSQPDHRVVVLGRGYGGLLPARRLKPAHVRVTLVDRTANHVFQPLHYQFATGIRCEGQIAPTLRSVLLRQRKSKSWSRARMAEPTLTQRP